jgi:hypothetical protein
MKALAAEFNFHWRMANGTDGGLFRTLNIWAGLTVAGQNPTMNQLLSSVSSMAAVRPTSVRPNLRLELRSRITQQPVTSAPKTFTTKPTTESPSPKFKIQPVAPLAPLDKVLDNMPKGTKGVALVGPKGKDTNVKLGEFDEVLPELFIEDKRGATDAIKKGLAYSPGTTFEAAVSEWAIKHIFRKTKGRIENLAIATKTIAEEGGARVVPNLEEIRGIRKLHFRIDGNDPILKKHVNDQIERLRVMFPDWTFTVEFSGWYGVM